MLLSRLIGTILVAFNVKVAKKFIYGYYGNLDNVLLRQVHFNIAFIVIRLRNPDVLRIGSDSG